MLSVAFPRERQSADTQFMERASRQWHDWEASRIEKPRGIFHQNQSADSRIWSPVGTHAEQSPIIELRIGPDSGAVIAGRCGRDGVGSRPGVTQHGAKQYRLRRLLSQKKPCVASSSFLPSNSILFEVWRGTKVLCN